MPHSEIHNRKRKKNWALLALIAGFVAIIWVITMVKLANAATTDLDIQNAFPQQRDRHAEFMDRQFESFDDLRAVTGKRGATNEEFGRQRYCHMLNLYKIAYDDERRKTHGCGK